MRQRIAFVRNAFGEYELHRTELGVRVRDGRLVLEARSYVSRGELPHQSKEKP